MIKTTPIYKDGEIITLNSRWIPAIDENGELKMFYRNEDDKIIEVRGLYD